MRRGLLLIAAAALLCAGAPAMAEKKTLAVVVKGLDNQLRVDGGGVLPADPTAQITSGALEGSNVDASGTLVDMIEAQRSFEQRAKLISTAEQLDQSSASLMSLG